MEQEQYVRPATLPPQLTRDQLAAMPPHDVVRAQELGQFAVLLDEGRDPIGPEQRGERRATAAEAEAQRQAEAERAAVLGTQLQRDLHNTLKENR